MSNRLLGKQSIAMSKHLPMCALSTLSAGLGEISVATTIRQNVQNSRMKPAMPGRYFCSM